MNPPWRTIQLVSVISLCEVNNHSIYLIVTICFVLIMENPRITLEEVGIIKKAQAGDMSAFNKLFHRYKGFVASVLFDYLKDMDESKDVTNVVFMKVYNKLSTFTEYDSFGGWLRVISRHVAIDYLRKIKYTSVSIDDTESRLQLEEPLEDGEGDLVNHLTHKRIIAELKNMPPMVRKVCTMFYVDNLKVAQISKLLSIPTGTIKSILCRTRRKLKKQLKQKKS